MIEREALRGYVLESLRYLGGTGTIVAVSRDVWQRHEADLRASGDLFFTWQYDIRWAAQYLRDQGYLVPVAGDRRAPWTLSDSGWNVEFGSRVGGSVASDQ